MKRSIIVCILLLVSHMITLANEASNNFIKQAQTCEERNDLQSAIALYRNAVEADPNHFEAFFGLANALYNSGDKEGAIAQYLKGIVLRPTCAQAYYNLGICFAHTGKNEQAIEYFKAATSHNPKYTKAFSQLGILLDHAHRGKEAIAAFEAVLMQEPDNFEAHFNLGNLCKHDDQFTKSIEHYRKALALKPDHTNTILELANTLNMVDQQPEECLSLYKKVLDGNPTHIAAKYNYGFTLKKLGYIPESIKEYDEVLQLKPDYALPHFSRGLAYLQIGDFDRGWEGYEWRWKAYDETPRKLSQPLWTGQNVAGKTIFVYAEQGLGDTMQFIRYLKLLKEQGARIIFQTQKPLATLLARCPYIDRVLISGDSMPAHIDFQVPLLSLPWIFKTRVDTVPVDIPYLDADPALVKFWQQKLAHDTNLKIGICWQGNPNYSTQFLRLAVAAKSMHVKMFEPLARIPGVSLYSLQKMSGTDQLKELDNQIIIRDFGSDFDESHGRFMDTAAVIPNLDLIVSVDTGTCHLAAALGAPTWIPLPYPADWRWMLDIEDTPWYPTVRLFRQKTSGDWQSIMQEIADEVAAIVEAKNKGIPVAEEIMRKTLRTKKQQELYASATQEKSTSHHTVQRAPNIVQSNVHNGSQDTALKDPALRKIVEQFQDTNAQLSDLDLQLKQCRCSVFDPQFIEITRKAFILYNMRAYLQERLGSLASA